MKANVEETRHFMEACAQHLGNDTEKQKCLNRMIKYFSKEKVVAGKTMEMLESLRTL